MTEQNDPNDEDVGLPPESPKSDPVPPEHMPATETDPEAETASGTETA